MAGLALVAAESTPPMALRSSPLARILGSLHPTDILLSCAMHEMFVNFAIHRTNYAVLATKPDGFFLLELSASHTNKLIENMQLNPASANHLRSEYESYMLQHLDADDYCGTSVRTLVVKVDAGENTNAALWAAVIRKICMRASPTIEKLLFLDGTINVNYPYRKCSDGRYESLPWNAALFDHLRLPELIPCLPNLHTLQVPNFQALLGVAHAMRQYKTSRIWQRRDDAAWKPFTSACMPKLQCLIMDQMFVYDVLQTQPSDAILRNITQNFFSNIQRFICRSDCRRWEQPNIGRKQHWVGVFGRMLVGFSTDANIIPKLLGKMCPHAEFKQLVQPALYVLHADVVENYFSGSDTKCTLLDARKEWTPTSLCDKYKTNVGRDVYFLNRVIDLFEYRAGHLLTFLPRIKQAVPADERGFVCIELLLEARTYLRIDMGPHWFVPDDQQLDFLVACGGLSMHACRTTLCVNQHWTWKFVCEVFNQFRRMWVACDEAGLSPRGRRFVLRIVENEAHATGKAQSADFLPTLKLIFDKWQNEENEAAKTSKTFPILNSADFVHRVDYVIQQRENEASHEFEARIESATRQATQTVETAREQSLVLLQQQQSRRESGPNFEECRLHLLSRVRVAVKRPGRRNIMQKASSSTGSESLLSEKSESKRPIALMQQSCPPPIDGAFRARLSMGLDRVLCTLFFWMEFIFGALKDMRRQVPMLMALLTVAYGLLFRAPTPFELYDCSTSGAFCYYGWFFLQSSYSRLLLLILVVVLWRFRFFDVNKDLEKMYWRTGRGTAAGWKAAENVEACGFPCKINPEAVEDDANADKPSVWQWKFRQRLPADLDVIGYTGKESGVLCKKLWYVENLLSVGCYSSSKKGWLFTTTAWALWLTRRFVVPYGLALYLWLNIQWPVWPPLTAPPASYYSNANVLLLCIYAVVKSVLMVFWSRCYLFDLIE